MSATAREPGFATAAPWPAFAFRGRAGELAPIVLKNAVLNLLTLTIYRFWGKTNVRRYLWRSTRFMDEPVEYTGTGGELFRGFAIVVLFVLLPIAAAGFLLDLFAAPDSPLAYAYRILIYPLLVYLIGLAVYLARRYRLSRTAWRGIRASMTGKPTSYGWRHLGCWTLVILTLGWAYPWMRTILFGRMMRETAFGNRRFSFATRSGPLYGRFAVCWGVSAVSLLAALVVAVFWLSFAARPAHEDFAALSGWGAAALFVPLIVLAPLIWPLYYAREMAVFAAATAYDGVRFDMRPTYGGLARLVLGNLLINLLTLGFGRPFAQMRVFRFVCQRLTLQGEPDVARILQSAAERPRAGEGLADAFDVGVV